MFCKPTSMIRLGLNVSDLGLQRGWSLMHLLNIFEIFPQVVIDPVLPSKVESSPVSNPY